MFHHHGLGCMAVVVVQVRVLYMGIDMAMVMLGAGSFAGGVPAFIALTCEKLTLWLGWQSQQVLVACGTRLGLQPDAQQTAGNTAAFPQSDRCRALPCL